MLTENTLIQNRYLIKKIIGKGGMGAVYLAEDIRFNNRVIALKQMLFSNNPKLKIAFEREANLLALLQHPRLPKVSDFFYEDNFQYLVMEYVSGDDLGTLFDNIGKPVEVERVLNWADSLLQILEYLHSQTPPVIHRDIKPQNLKLTSDDQLILLDFGLAKDTLTHLSRLTASNSLVGYTPNYAPLEQIKGDHTTPQTDLFALSATLYHLLTNTVPPDSLTRAQAKVDELPDPLIPAHLINPKIPMPLSELLTQGLMLKRENRLQSASEMRKRVKDIYDEYKEFSDAETERLDIKNLPISDSATDTLRLVNLSTKPTPSQEIQEIEAKDTEHLPLVETKKNVSVPILLPQKPNRTPIYLVSALICLIGAGIAFFYFISQKNVSNEIPVVEAQEVKVMEAEGENKNTNLNAASNGNSQIVEEKASKISNSSIPTTKPPSVNKTKPKSVITTKTQPVAVNTPRPQPAKPVPQVRPKSTTTGKSRDIAQ